MNQPATADSNSPNPSDQKALPFSQLWPLLAGALMGIALRLAFRGHPGHSFAPMMASFIFLAPLLVGAVTVYVAEKQRRRSWGYYLWAPAIANVFFVMGTLIIMIEGIICALLIVPLFAALGAVGGVVMGSVCRLTRWPKQTVYSIAALPFVFGSFESKLPLPDRIETVEHRLLIDAPPERVWSQIWDVRDIRPAEVDRAWMYRIGVPLPMSGITLSTPDGLVRHITMGKNIHFDQVFVDWQPNRYVLWTYRFTADSFPPAALDDHVKIGGQYFDLITTSYTLTPAGKRTELKILMQYRVSTQFNWYADPIAKLLIGNFEEVILDFYRHRSEASDVPDAVLSSQS